MQLFSTLLDLACGRELPDEKQGTASRLRLAIAALFCALVLSSLWGAAVGSRPVCTSSVPWRQDHRVVGRPSTVTRRGAVGAGMRRVQARRGGLGGWVKSIVSSLRR